MKVLREEVENRVGDTVSISPEVNRKIWENGAENPPKSLEIEVEDTTDGKTVVLSGQEEDLEKVQEQETEEEAGEAEDYSEIVSGTVSEAKNSIQDMENPDYEAVLEAEEEGKNRKTLKEWLEQRM